MEVKINGNDAEERLSGTHRDWSVAILIMPGLDGRKLDGSRTLAWLVSFNPTSRSLEHAFEACGCRY